MSLIYIVLLLIIILNLWGYFKIMGLITEQSENIEDLTNELIQLEVEISAIHHDLKKIKEVK